jgi:hypothetical protein
VNSPGIADTALKFIITSLPKNGVILRKTDTLKIGQFFTQAEIKASLINYVHTNKNSIQDVFGYILSNGAGGFIPLNFLHVKIDNSVNTTSLPSALTFTIFPNPSAGAFNLNVKSSSADIVQVRVLDVRGRVMKSLKTNASETTLIDLNLLPGVYYFEVKQGSETRIVKAVKL